MGPGHDFSPYTSWRKRSERASSLMVGWRRWHQDRAHSELHIFRGPGYCSSQGSCLGTQAMLLFDLFLPRLIFLWKEEANWATFFSSCLQPLLWLTSV